MVELANIRDMPPGREADKHERRRVLDVFGNHVATVSAKSSAAVAARVAGTPHVKLAELNGEVSWRAFKPNKGWPQVSAVPLDASLRQAKGSVTRRPTKPETSARPKR